LEIGSWTLTLSPHRQSSFRFENLTTLEQFREVERLEGEIWGPIDLVPVPIMAVSVRRGAVLVGAFDGPRLAGFVYSFPALRPSAGSGHYVALSAHTAIAESAPKGPDPDRPAASHWSHMLGVHPDYRGAGLGRALKVSQRARVLALGIDLIEWTYDPLQALNAHLNFVSLGAIVEEYEENVYGESTSPLHGGLPTDRFVCQWWIARPHVARRIARHDSTDALTLVSHEVASAPVVNDTTVLDGWLECGDLHLGLGDRRVAVDIPLDFTKMLAAHPERAKRWRFQTRELFTHYFARGYRVVDFALHGEQSRGRYLLTSIPPVE
jgi:predicted GNAT superfamily acetyltransferase